ncbi:MAG: mevalonate kinase [Anaerolineae bacterium]|nr:mevalonate kinase [Anaerolineae bacterium]
MSVDIVERTAPGKVILCGEHSVVYGRPAIAVPVGTLRATARVVPGPVGSGLHIHALDLNQTIALSATGTSHPLAKIARLVLDTLGVPEPDAVLSLISDLPVASGMGSGTAVTVAAARALSASLGRPLPPETVSALTYEVEKIHHGTPSGIDNTVIAYEQPVFFVRGAAPETFRIHTPFHLLIASSGIAASTVGSVTEVRHRWEAAQSYYNVIFDCIGAIALAARAAVEQGALGALGVLFNENHGLLAKMGVSLYQLDLLTDAAREAGALGAKLTGSGQGGNIIALVEPERLDAVRLALTSAGATATWSVLIGT